MLTNPHHRMFLANKFDISEKTVLEVMRTWQCDFLRVLRLQLHEQKIKHGAWERKVGATAMIH